MEPFTRRPTERVPIRRPVVGVTQRPTLTPSNPAPQQPTAIPQPKPQAQPLPKPSLLQPPTLSSPGPNMDIRLAAPRTQTHSTAPLQPARPQQTPSISPPVANIPPQQTAPAVSAPVHQHAHTDTHAPKHHKESGITTHAGLVGFITFLIVGGLFLAPLLPGKIWKTAPGSLNTFSTGTQNISCIGATGKTSTAVSYGLKLGFPLNYNYSSTSTISASCDGKTQHAISSHSSQFNPLALLIDFSLTVIVAIATAKIWHKVRASRV